MVGHPIKTAELELKPNPEPPTGWEFIQQQRVCMLETQREEITSRVNEELRYQFNRDGNTQRNIMNVQLTAKP